jgi:hypothetical protein
VVFNRLDHHLVLELGTAHLHAPCPTNGWMGDVAIAGNFIARVDHHNAAVQIIRKHSGNLAKCCGFTNTWTPHEQQRLTRIEQIAHHGDGPKNGPSNPTGETHHFPLTISNRTDAMEGALDSRPVVCSETAEPGYNSLKIVPCQGGVVQFESTARVTGFRSTSKIENNFQQLVTSLQRRQRHLNGLRQEIEKTIQVISDPLCRHESRP